MISYFLSTINASLFVVIFVILIDSTKSSLGISAFMSNVWSGPFFKIQVYAFSYGRVSSFVAYPKRLLAVSVFQIMGYKRTIHVQEC